MFLKENIKRIKGAEHIRRALQAAADSFSIRLIFAAGAGLFNDDPCKVIVHGGRILAARGQDEAAVLFVVVYLLAAEGAKLILGAGHEEAGVDVADEGGKVAVLFLHLCGGGAVVGE